MHKSYSERAEKMTKPCVQSPQQSRGWGQQPFHYSCQQHQGQGNAEERVHDAEQLPWTRERRDVPVAWNVN